MELRHRDLTEKIIQCCFKVHNTLGFGFLEMVYENALVIELSKAGLIIKQQHPIQVYYDGQTVGDYQVDILVEGKVILELKSVDRIIDIHEIQLKNYLKATGIEVGLLINFGKSVEIKRKYNSSSVESQ
jgi:GxxExxY protein